MGGGGRVRRLEVVPFRRAYRAGRLVREMPDAIYRWGVMASTLPVGFVPRSVAVAFLCSWWLHSTYIPAARELAELPGGRIRPSVELDLSDYPAVELRNDLNARLLDTTYPVGAQQPEHQFSLDVLDLLVLVTAERFGGESALLRR
jgi:hypothetical protein